MINLFSIFTFVAFLLAQNARAQFLDGLPPLVNSEENYGPLLEGYSYPRAPTPQNDSELELPMCEDIASEEPPFFVSDTYMQTATNRLGTQVNLEYENFRDLEDPSNNRLNRYIPRGSIVYTPPELMEIDDQPRRVPVKVLNVRTEVEETARNAGRVRGGDWFKSLFLRSGSRTRQVNEASRVEVGDVGYIDNNSLKPAGEFVFYLEKDSPVYSTPSGVPLNGKAIRPKMLDEENYLKRKCCFQVPNLEGAAENLTNGFQNPEDLLKEICFEFHLYDVFDENNELVAESQILDGLGCGLIGNLEAIPNALDPAISGINNILQQNRAAFSVLDEEFGVEDLEILMVDATVDGESVKEPTVRIPVNDRTNLGPFNTRVYSPDSENIDGRLHPMATCGFLRIAQAWQEICSDPGCQIQFGNAYVHDRWGPHTSHDSARCMDIRPFRLSELEDPDPEAHPDEDRGVHYLWHGPRVEPQNRRYDQEKTINFMSLLVRAGADVVIFGDAGAVNAVNAVRRDTQTTDPENYNPSAVQRDGSGLHHNHIHFCLDPERDQVQETCDGELLEDRQTRRQRQ
ncbi:MAG: hypothetical protein CME65_04025 [Halobacteriovoraceae bacterium]|nr:hypothetical protein [Halobacteriovoraceae bacterium]